MKKFFVLGLMLSFAFNLTAQKVEDLKSYKKNGDKVTVVATKHDVFFNAAAAGADPLAKIVLKDKYNSNVGVLNFYPAGHKTIGTKTTKTDRIGFTLNYSMDVFEVMTEMLEDNAATIEFNTKSQEAALMFGNLASGVNTKPGTRATGRTTGQVGTKSNTSGTQKVTRGAKLAPSGTGTLKKAPR